MKDGSWDGIDSTHDHENKDPSVRVFFDSCCPVDG